MNNTITIRHLGERLIVLEGIRTLDAAPRELELSGEHDDCACSQAETETARTTDYGFKLLTIADINRAHRIAFNLQ